MKARARRWFRVSLPLLTITCLLLGSAETARAVPAAGIIEPLVQPDGQVVWVKQFGDERSSGLETTDGYTILQDPTSGYWVYAEQVPGGGIRGSSRVVGRDLPLGISKRLRMPPAPVATPPVAEAGPQAPATLGSQPVLTLFVDFTPSVRVGTTAPDWNTRLFGTTGSAKGYYEEVSYGGFTLTPAPETETTLAGSVNDGIVSVTLPYAHPNTGGNTDYRNQQIVRDALLAADPYVNFAVFDTNGDGVLSASELHLLVIVAGYEASYSSSRCGPSVWAHKWGVSSAPTLDGKVVGRTYTQIGEWHCSTSSPPGHAATIGTVVHELAHDLGLPDLYDTDDSSEGVGYWSVMGSGSWNRVTFPGDSPAHMDPWSKTFEGWVTPTVVTGTLIIDFCISNAIG